MQAESRVIVARIERHPYGRELVIAFDDGDDVIETRLERSGTAALEQRAEEIREVLAAKQWTPTATISAYSAEGTRRFAG